MAYDEITTINTSSGIVSILEYVNQVTDFWISRMLMVAIFVIFAMGYYRSRDGDIVGAFSVGSFVTLCVGVLFWIIGFLDGKTFSLIIGITLVAGAWLFLDKRSNN